MAGNGSWLFPRLQWLLGFAGGEMGETILGRFRRPRVACAESWRDPRRALDQAGPVLTGLLIVVGLWLRARGYLYDTLALWLDEATWSIALIEQPLIEHLIRPIGFMALSKALVSVFSASETVLRSVPWAAGVGVLLLAPSLARRLYVAPAARIFFVAILALHPAVIDLSKEFKPYSVSVLCHMVLLVLALRYVAIRGKREIGWALAGAVLVQLFAQDVVFAYPGFFLVIALTAWRERKASHCVATAAGAALVILLLVCQYVFIWSRLESSEAEYWAKKYNVFRSEASSESYASWWSWKYWTIATFPGFRSAIWQSNWLPSGELRHLADLNGFLWVSLHALGAIAMFARKRVYHVLLLLSPLLVMTLFNRLGYWPFGVFRTNLFVIVYAAAIPVMALDGSPERRARWMGPLPALALVILPLLMFEHNWHARKRSLAVHSNFPAILETLFEQRVGNSDPAPETLFLGSGTCELWDYYTHYHPETSRQFGRTLQTAYNARCIGQGRFSGEVQRALRKSDQRAWIVTRRPRYVERLKKGSLKKFRQRRFSVGTHAVYSFSRK